MTAKLEFHKTLNSRLWDGTELRPAVRRHLLEIAEFFIQNLGVPDLDVLDITLSGSNASFTYTPQSDIDLHIVVHVPAEKERFYKNFFDAKKNLFNTKHNINIYSQPVELYVQLDNENHISNGLYSVQNGTWLQQPTRQRAHINHTTVQKKLHEYKWAINHCIQENDIQAAKTLVRRLKIFRKIGLARFGELGSSNLAWKLLRNSGYLDRLNDFITDYTDKELSLESLS